MTRQPSIYRRQEFFRQYTLPFYGNTGWETVLAYPPAFGQLWSLIKSKRD